MTAPTMPADTAEWIRANAWTGSMRKTFREVPGFYLACACQYGLTGFCRSGDHGQCHRAAPLHDAETTICRRGGDEPAAFRRPFRHKALTSAVGPHRTRYAEVWLADRACRWQCPCDCHPGQLNLFPQGVRA
jgi:hypothetical protein